MTPRQNSPQVISRGCIFLLLVKVTPPTPYLAFPFGDLATALAVALNRIASHYRCEAFYLFAPFGRKMVAFSLRFKSFTCRSVVPPVASIAQLAVKGKHAWCVRQLLPCRHFLHAKPLTDYL